MAEVTYQDAVRMIGEYYGTGSDIWRKYAGPGMWEVSELDVDAFEQAGVRITRANDGRFVGWDVENPFYSNISTGFDEVNSNLQTPQYGDRSVSFNGRVNGSYTWDGQTSSPRMSSGARSVSTGAKVATVASKLSTAVTAVSAGLFLGAKIDSALYKAGNFFNLHPPEALNPETWDSLATTEQGQQMIRNLFHIGGTDSTMYMPEDMIGYMYQYWNSLGVWSQPGVNPNESYNDGTYTYTWNSTPGATTSTGYVVEYRNLSDTVTFSHPVTVIVEERPTYFRTHYISKDPFTITFQRGSQAPSTSTTTIVYHDPITDNPYYTAYNDSYKTNFGNIVSFPFPTVLQDVLLSTVLYRNGTQYQTGLSAFTTYYLPWLLFNSTTSTGGPEGFERDPNATDQPQPAQIDPTQPILPQLKQQMPNAFKNPIYEDVPQKDGSTKRITYYPVPWPNISNTDRPTSGDKNQNDPTVRADDPTDMTAPMKDVITNPNPQPETPMPGEPAEPPTTGTGTGPTAAVPSGSASSLWAVYNPTQAQVDAFGAWLWSSDLVEQIKKLFNDPMQAIIGIHKVFATPATGAAQNIKCGYIDSGVPSAVVTSQYTTVDCGTVNLREYFGNVFDYPPYTEVQLYLPFIGIVNLDVADVMRSNINVKYHVDVITGACLAEVRVTRDGSGGVLYQYSGSAVVTYPISSGSYASALTGVLSIAGGIAATVASGGAAAPALLGGAVGATKLHSDVRTGGSFTGSAGAMGIKKPYLIISRPQTALPARFPEYKGKPASKTVKLSACSGFVRVDSINIDNIPATDTELAEIKSLLQSGVIV